MNRWSSLFLVSLCAVLAPAGMASLMLVENEVITTNSGPTPDPGTNPFVPIGGDQYLIQLYDGTGTGVADRYARFFFDIRNGQFTSFTSGAGGTTQDEILQVGENFSTTTALASGTRLSLNGASGLTPGFNAVQHNPDTSSTANGGEPIVFGFFWDDVDGSGGGSLADTWEYLGAVYSPGQDDMINDVSMIYNLLVPEPSRAMLLALGGMAFLLRRQR